MTPNADARVLCVGVGGLASPALQVLLRSGIRHFTLADDDLVEESNLQRQTLFDDRHLGQPKVTAAAARLEELWAASAPDRPNASAPLRIETRMERALPNNILGLVQDHTLVLEGGDNFATKFMMADACRIARLPLVQAGVVRWAGWALASTAGSACLRCVFEDIPQARDRSCAAEGVVGPVVGVLGAYQAALALRLLAGDGTAAGELAHYDGLAGRIRRLHVTSRPGCPLCTGTINSMDMARYTAPGCAA